MSIFYKIFISSYFYQLTLYISPQSPFIFSFAFNVLTSPLNLLLSFHLPLMPFITLPFPHKTWINYAIIPAISKEIIEQNTHITQDTLTHSYKKSYEFPPEKLVFLILKYVYKNENVFK